jgi:hypothetical protein
MSTTAEPCPLQRASRDCNDSRSGQRRVGSSTADEHGTRRPASLRTTKVSNKRLADISGHRELTSAALTSHRELAANPLDVIELKGGDLARA